MIRTKILTPTTTKNNIQTLIVTHLKGNRMFLEKSYSFTRRPIQHCRRQNQLNKYKKRQTHNKSITFEKSTTNIVVIHFLQLKESITLTFNNLRCMLCMLCAEEIWHSLINFHRSQTGQRPSRVTWRRAFFLSRVLSFATFSLSLYPLIVFPWSKAILQCPCADCLLVAEIRDTEECGNSPPTIPAV